MRKQRLEKKQKRLKDKHQEAIDSLEELKTLKKIDEKKKGGAVGTPINIYSSGGYVEGK